MSQAKHTRATVAEASKRAILHNEGGDPYLEYRIYKRGGVSAVKAEEEMIEAIDDIGSLVRQLEGNLERSKTSTGYEKLDSIDNFVEGPARLADVITITMGKFADGAVQISGRARPSRPTAGGPGRMRR